MTERDRRDTPPFPGSHVPAALIANQVSHLIRDVGAMRDSLARLSERSDEYRRASERFEAIDFARAINEIERLRDRIGGAEAKLAALEVFGRTVDSLSHAVEDLRHWRSKVMGGALVVSIVGSGLGSALPILAKWLIGG
jgi:hypothetical protein